jgi:hypothetical protein
MSFVTEELRNYTLKAQLGILGTGNRSTAPDNMTFYEEWTTGDNIVKPTSVWSDISSIPAAANLAAASAAATANPTIIQEYDTTTAIRCTPSANNNVFFATTTYNDLSTRIGNWIQPQLIPQPSGAPSIGYTIRLYNGDPNAGGTEITTSQEQSGAVVGWWIAYGAGAIVTASSFTSIVDPTDVWITGFRYIGTTGGSGGTPTGEPLAIRLAAEEIDGTTNAIDTDISLYQVPGGSSVIAGSVVITNRNASTVSVRVAHVDGAIGSVANADYIFYDVPLVGYETKTISIPGMEASDSILVRSDTTDVNFKLSGLYAATVSAIKRIAAYNVAVADTNEQVINLSSDTANLKVYICNKDSSNTAVIRLALIDGALGALADEDYSLYNEYLSPLETKAYQLGEGLSSGNTIMIRSDDTDINIVVYGEEY